MPTASRTAARLPRGWDWYRDKILPAARPGISKHGDVYLRTLLIHGARAVLRHLEHRAYRTDDWLRRLLGRRNKNVAAVALANKNARIAWALLAHQRDFAPDYISTAPSR